MDKRNTRLVLTLGLGGVLLAAKGVTAADSSKGAAATAKAQTAVESPPQLPAVAQPETPVTPKTPEEEVRSQLDGTEWVVQLTPSAGAKDTKPKKDTVRFSGRQVTSSFLSKAGYPSSNYSITIGSDGVGVWETMQTKEGEGVAFWRGELRGSTMRGVLSKHPVEGEAEDYSFAGQVTGNKEIIVPALAASSTEVKAQQPAQTAPAATSASSSAAGSSTKQPMTTEQKPTAKKRRWF